LFIGTHNFLSHWNCLTHLVHLLVHLHITPALCPSTRYLISSSPPCPTRFHIYLPPYSSRALPIALDFSSSLPRPAHLLPHYSFCSHPAQRPWHLLIIPAHCRLHKYLLIAPASGQSPLIPSHISRALPIAPNTCLCTRIRASRDFNSVSMRREIYIDDSLVVYSHRKLKLYDSFTVDNNWVLEVLSVISLYISCSCSFRLSAELLLAAL